MPAGSLYVLLISLGVGVLLIVLGVPLMLRRVQPNAWYGFRVGRAQEDDRAWYAANAASGRWLVITGSGVALTSILNAAFSTQTAIALLLNGVIMTLGIIISVGAGFAAMISDDFPPDDLRRL